jgi:hypothetical protein
VLTKAHASVKLAHMTDMARRIAALRAHNAVVGSSVPGNVPVRSDAWLDLTIVATRAHQDRR